MTIYSDKLSEDYSKNRDNFIATDEHVFTLLNKIGIEGKDILDFGCGDGRYAFKFSELGAKSVLGIDISPGMIELANQKLSANHKNIQFIESDGAQLDLVDDSVDIVFANFVFHHFLDSLKPISEIHRVLRKDGIFLCTLSAYEIAPGAEDLINTDIPIRLGHGENSVLVHNFVKPKKEVYNNLIKSGFEVIEYKSVDNPDANIDSTYQHKDKIGKLTIISLAKKL
jgi:ubiquinone/menaquinone biosynthesis C-methylase UbiE